MEIEDHACQRTHFVRKHLAYKNAVTEEPRIKQKLIIYYLKILELNSFLSFLLYSQGASTFSSQTVRELRVRKCGQR